ncbi:hypothetical protein AGMMS4956_10350 [Bacteroidia bacterium]|nr:hypothetical protein AGMMS4956_10350 [Bacteroidia bacterium]
MHFNWWWIVDIDTYFYCKKCGVKLAHISPVVVAVLAAWGLGMLYNFYQNQGLLQTSIVPRIVTIAILLWIVIALIRVALLWVLYKIKFSNKIVAKKTNKTNKEEVWWEPFTNA